MGAVLFAGLLATPAATGSATGAPQAGCEGGTESDFNGDGLRDLAVGDPEATVDGESKAGLVRVFFGGGKGVAEISQELTNDRAAPEANDGYGHAIATYDADQDGCSDLVVGVPYEDVTKDGAALPDAGAIYIVHGSPSGFSADSAVETYTQKSLASWVSTEAGDLFGYALAAGETDAGEPFLTVGVPGEAVGALDDAGCIHYVLGGTSATANQDDPGVPGVAEANDRFGASLAATPDYFAAGSPGEALGNESFAGSVAVFGQEVDGRTPVAMTGVSEDHPALTSGTAEGQDRFGTALSMLPYRPEGAASETDALLAVGTPGEDVGTVADAGAVTVIRIQPSAAVTEKGLVDRFSPGVEGDPVVGDFFGHSVALANTAPGAVGSSSTVKLAVGVPHQEVGPAEMAGAVHVMPGLGDPGQGDRVLTRGDGLLPGVAGARERTGWGLHADAGSLYVGIPYSRGDEAPHGVVYGLPWEAVAAGSGGVATYRPGAGGAPDEGAAFGWVIR
ncbi:VCBS repeat-containing protein [Streptomyces sp. RKND-216]|uniref:FG-GAP repeat domain-containing protein n=1 Tax=Streptomyces sp. RKND-216 TaxID=2562581 RepID=UPI001FF947AC|nr:VCBS repeat-containing protein [Streptomyces sp. RKND-216]